MVALIGDSDLVRADDLRSLKADVALVLAELPGRRDWWSDRRTSRPTGGNAVLKDLVPPLAVARTRWPCWHASTATHG